MSARDLQVDSCPASDVSAGVGLSGLAGLFVWMMICRNWPGLVDAFHLPGPQARLSGPYAALMGLLFTGTPMVLWSILIDKVHLRPSTGIEWTSPRPVADIIDISITKIAGLWATWALIGGLYCIARWYWRGQYVFAMDVLGMMAVPLFLLAIPYVLWLDRVLVEPRDSSWHFGAMLIGREACDLDEVWHHLRAWAVKGFFCAFMISIMPGGFAAIVEWDIGETWGNPVGMTILLTELMFLADVHVAMVGYLVTMKPLDAQIRSANPYLGGWVAALICYPPFILMGGGDVLDYRQATQEWNAWLAGHDVLLWVWGAMLVVLTAIYAWATIAFGLRFSNLTYRGVLTNGPYRFTKHPAYLSKNAYWWLATMPFLATSGSMVDMIRNTVLLAMVSGVYYWRARTEEKHLLAEDPKYRDYCEWMMRNAFITRSLHRLGQALKPQGPRLQPAE